MIPGHPGHYQRWRAVRWWLLQWQELIQRIFQNEGFGEALRGYRASPGHCSLATARAAARPALWRANQRVLLEGQRPSKPAIVQVNSAFTTHKSRSTLLHNCHLTEYRKRCVIMFLLRYW